MPKIQFLMKKLLAQRTSFEYS